MSNAQKAADEIINLANKFRSLFQAADALAVVGSLDQASKDAVIRKDAAYGEAEKADAELCKRKEVLAAVNKEIDEVVVRGEALEESAKLKAKCILDEAVEKAAMVSRETEMNKKAVEHEIKGLNGAIGLVKLEIDAKNRELESIISQVKLMKDKILAFTR